MKRILFATLCLVVLLQVPAYAADAKIGVFSMQKLMLESDASQDAGAQMKAEFEPLIKDLEREKAAIQKMEEDIKKQDLALKLDAKQDMQRKLRSRIRDYQDSAVALQQKQASQSQKLQKPILELIQKVVDEYGKKHKMTVIMDMRVAGIVYFDNSVEITDALMAEMNKQWKAKK
ncbi:OmpH family outer membrane protein [Pseudodesulfovibrio tunisiensis]|uniref:OmpH family outer membrane protein n=1 Tax=Pseudodesulfovibrio tunisiensis TaxID=463192 RepID=UPI001FB55C9F|nr:OmpH family outer membrane protein [Pseudodesulfovibrio tunisiensis]